MKAENTPLDRRQLDSVTTSSQEVKNGRKSSKD